MDPSHPFGSNVLPFPITNYSSFEIFSRASPGSFTICFPYRFAIYDTSKAWITERRGGQSVGYLTRFLLAGFSGAVGAVVGGPPDLVLVRMQVWPLTQFFYVSFFVKTH